MRTLQEFLAQPTAFHAVPQAGDPVFSWCLSEASRDVEPRVLKAQFGDGYAQRAADGINTQQQKWQVTLKNISQQTRDEVYTFLAARNGVDCFWWTPPLTSVALWVLCPKWSDSYGELASEGERLFNMQMEFQTEPS